MNNASLPQPLELNQTARRSPPPTLKAYALAAAAAQIDLTTARSPETQFLQQQFQIVAPHQEPWNQHLSQYLEHPEAGDRPLIQLSQVLHLTVIELLTIALAVAVEEDVMVGRTLAYLQAPLGGSRPTLGFVTTIFAETVRESDRPLHLLVNDNAVRSGLLTLLNEQAPLPERTVSVPLHLGFALGNQDGRVAGTTLGTDNSLNIPLPHSVTEIAQRHAVSLQAAERRVLVLRTGSNAEGRSVAEAIAQAMQCRPLFIETNHLTGIGPWLLLRQLLPVFCLELAPGERQVLPEIPAYSGPVVVLCGPDGSIEASGGTALTWSIPTPSPSERQALWQAALDDEQLAQNLATHHRHSSGRIAQLGRLANQYSLLSGHPHPTWQDVTAAAWSGEGTGLDALAQPLPDRIPDEALVITPTLRQELDTLLLRCRYRDGLIEGLGASTTARYHPGVRSLFVGPSGTGKTLAAGWLATQLGLPLYRVDLAAISSKYIGETEKNLSQLLARAEQAEVVLLFDEADSLFGKRTDVQQANDRFANAQTNYLLQRIESFDGITLLTSNSRSRFDSAFSRRLDLVIEFPLPRPQERRSLWQSHLGTHHNLTPQDLNQLAATTDLCGGHIRNAVLTAAVLAQSQNHPITYTDIIQGIATEYRKLGRQIPAALKAQP